MAQQKIDFSNPAGERLAGLLARPAGRPRAFALFAHCFTCSKNLKAATVLSRALTEQGFAVLRFDFTGLGESSGDFADSNFSSNVADLLAAADYLRREHEAPAILVGHSLGGTAMLQAAADIPEAVAVATIGSPASPTHVEHLLRDDANTIADAGEATVDLGGRPFRIKRQFVEDLKRHPLPQSLGGLRKALLILHAPLDDTVGIDNAGELFEAAKHPKSFVSLDGADHLLTRTADAEYAATVLAAWASRYLAPDVAEPAPPTHGVRATTRIDGFRTEVLAAGHALIADEPTAVGGTNLGPTPYDLLSAALATCTTMTLKMYATHKSLPVESISADVVHNKLHADDCADCETSAGRIDEFQRALTVIGALTPEQRQRMLEIADRCPVHRTLHGEIKVRTRLVDE